MAEVVRTEAGTLAGQQALSPSPSADNRPQAGDPRSHAGGASGTSAQHRTAALPGDNILAPRGKVWPGPPVEYAICPESTDLPPGCPPLTDQWQTTRFSDYKHGFFQKLASSGAWIDGGRAADVGIVESQLFGTFALPLPNRNDPLLVTPEFDTRWLSGPLFPDAPARLYSAYVEMMWVPKITDRWTGILGVTPGIYSDFRHNYGDQWRMMGRGLARYELRKGRTFLIAGVLYLPRSDFRIIPAGGLMWSPWDDVQLDLIFPIPRLAYRLSYDNVIERWVYLAGEFGGGTWSVERADGSPDVLTLRDLRLLLGVERKRDGGGGTRLELGYVFGRVLEYDSATPTLNLPDTVMLRGRLAF